MLPGEFRLYTWVDVEDVLLRLEKEGRWPDWLLTVRAYWDGVEVQVLPEQRSSALSWLAEAFEPRFHLEPPEIELESTRDKRRGLPVVIAESAEEPRRTPFRPTLARPSVIGRSYPPTPPASAEMPPIVAFHSFKGGVGRTVHALAFAAFTLQRHSTVLLVDADLEAPGLTWFFQSRFPNPPISFVDFLTLVHGDQDPSFAASLELVADRIRGTRADGLFTLPSFRSPQQFTSLEVRPEHLIRAAADPFVLTSMLGQLGARLGVSAVVVDLRAGLSEISAGLLLDPRVYRVLVTTTSSQSVLGSAQLLRLLGELAPSRREQEPLPALIISQVPEGDVGDELAAQAESSLLDAGSKFFDQVDESGSVQSLDFPRIRTPHESALISLPSSWQDVLDRIRDSRVVRELAPLSDWLPLSTVSGAKARDKSRSGGPKRQREALAHFTSRLIYAETGNISEFLAITPLRNLASDFSSSVPVVVVVGSKGAGKTYTFLQVVWRGSWEAYAKAAGSVNPIIQAAVCPVLTSLNVKDEARLQVEKTQLEASKKLGFEKPHGSPEIRDYLRAGLKLNLHEGEWRDRWLNVIAWSIGFDVGKEDAGRRLGETLRHRSCFVVALVDGLEDVFQEFWSNTSQQVALRALLQDVPEWLSQQPGLPIGLLAFVRRDMVLSVIRQNPAQLIAKYEPYALRWSPDEALRLVAWICWKAEVLDRDLDLASVEQGDRRYLVDLLSVLWGRKLGGPKSREALSADWVIAALSDLRGQIQARDVVRFLHEAARGSVGDSFWKDRVLVPTAIRSAVASCSEQKIEETGLENPRLGEIFSKLKILPEESRQIPFTAEQVELDLDALKILEENGAVVREGQEYYMPEIFRSGLGFKLRKGARPRVMTMARRTKR